VRRDHFSFIRQDRERGQPSWQCPQRLLLTATDIGQISDRPRQQPGCPVDKAPQTSGELAVAAAGNIEPVFDVPCDVRGVVLRLVVRQSRSFRQHALMFASLSAGPGVESRYLQLLDRIWHPYFAPFAQRKSYLPAAVKNPVGRAVNKHWRRRWMPNELIGHATQ
jgi:hypothetical protein